jgi:hypothetical protein
MTNFGQMAAYGETRVTLEPIPVSLSGPSDEQLGQDREIARAVT